ncbi:hypothetical protein OUZ56_015818 [Daphnia magna]|uniref:Uncharacterized protein n=1 Tax=Daphnia magna TaxID=35525 RepID=A0ABR0ANX5_9CRUS|nr:hypothetical protein OUZ56_015818 [Daphnia magna]
MTGSSVIESASTCSREMKCEFNKYKNTLGIVAFRNKFKGGQLVEKNVNEETPPFTGKNKKKVQIKKWDIKGLSNVLVADDIMIRTESKCRRVVEHNGFGFLNKFRSINTHIRMWTGQSNEARLSNHLIGSFETRHHHGGC